MIYLDNAASSWPKPPKVITAMEEVLVNFGANPGRSGHQLAQRAEDAIQKTRIQLARLFHVKNSSDIVFTQNATESLNLGIKGFLHSGDHVISTSFEHNSVRRPLEFMRRAGVEVIYINAVGSNEEILRDVEQSITRNTKLLVVTHASNLTGRIMPVAELGQIAKNHQMKFLVDASQTAGYVPIDVNQMGIDMLAFTGHKSLYGPQGTGGLYIDPEVNLTPLLHGGTGGYSELIDQPPLRPDRYESGTRNTVGIAGLGAGISFIENTGIQTIRNHEERLTHLLIDGISSINGVTLYVPANDVARCPIVSFAIEGFASSEIGFILDTHYDIAVRAGLHCTPLAHETLGTLEEGLVRASIGYFNTEHEIDEFVHAIKDIVG